MFRILLLLSLLVACGKHPDPTSSVIETFGSTEVQINSVATFERADLPAGVEAKDVLKIITIKDDPLTTFATGTGVVAVFSKALNPKPTPKPARQIIIMKDGTVIAGKEATAQIENIETVKPSRAWIFWTLAGVGVLLAAGWGLKQFAVVFAPAAKIVSFVGGLFKRG